MGLAKRLDGMRLFDGDGYELLGCPVVVRHSGSQGLRMPFGKHVGQLVSGVPTRYLVWALAEWEEMDPGIRREAERVVRFRELRRVTPRPQGCEDMPGGTRQRAKRRGE